MQIEVRSHGEPQLLYEAFSFVGSGETSPSGGSVHEHGAPVGTEVIVAF